MDYIKLFLHFFLDIVNLLLNDCDFSHLIWDVSLLVTPANYMAGFMRMEDIFFQLVRIVPFAFSL